MSRQLPPDNSPSIHTDDSDQDDEEPDNLMVSENGDNESPSQSCSTDDQPLRDEEDQPQDMEELERNKIAVYKHPLFPLVASLLEKCEYATATLRMPNSTQQSTPSSRSSQSDEDSLQTCQPFQSDIEAFFAQREGLPVRSGDAELDNLMIKAIQVLRIHLGELEKVQDLCHDFCQRYITCLRTKMSSENLLRGTTGLGSFEGSSRSSSPSSDDNSYPCPPPPPHSFPSQTGFPLPSSQGLGFFVDGSNTMRQGLPPEVQRDSGNEGDLSDDATHPNGSSSSKKIQQKRGILPKQATSIMRSWLFQHIVHPYPTEEEKRTIAAQTNLTLLQVNNWFINARRRILQPMLDSANSSLNSENNSNGSNSQSKAGPSTSSSPKPAKKLASSASFSQSKNNYPSDRLWPESLATARSSTD